MTRQPERLFRRSSLTLHDETRDPETIKGLQRRISDVASDTMCARRASRENANLFKDNHEIRTDTKYIRQSSDDTGQKHIFCRYWRRFDKKHNAPSVFDETKLQATVFICHGYGEHIEWYSDLAISFATRRWFTFGHDHSGHGKSDGSRGFIENIDDLVSDVLYHVAKVKSEMLPGLPCYIYGHSMGGLIALKAVVRNPALFSGLLLEGPLFSLSPIDRIVKYGIGKLLSLISNRIPVEWIPRREVTSQKDVMEKIESDDLWFKGGVPLASALTFVEGLRAVKEKMSNVTIPFIVMHGQYDTICSPQGSKDFYQTAKSHDKTIIIFPNAKHHLLLETFEHKSKIIKESVNWIRERIPGVLYDAEARKYIYSVVATDDCDADQEYRL